MKIVLFEPDMAQNLGAAIRLSACFGVSLEIIEPCGFPLTSKDIRRTALDYGAPELLIRHKNWEHFQQSCLKQAARTILLTTKAAKPMTDFEFERQDILIFGRESAGVPQHVHDSVDARIFVPIAASARSFNLVSSASIALFEALRQTGQLPKT